MAEISPEEASPPSRSRQSKHVSKACDACRKTKRKCDGSWPCSACQNRLMTCTFGENNDARRGRKRTMDHLSTKADALDLLLDTLKSSDDSSVLDLIRLIKNEASLEDIVQLSKEVLRHNETRSRSRTRVRNAVLDIATLIDEPPIRVPAQPWTTVTDDDLAVSHLVSIYFTWQHHGYPCLDQDIFVEAMQSQDTRSLYCSPLLVNSILAVACVYTDHRSVFADPDDLYSRALHFQKEAVRLWELELGAAKLTTLQAYPPLTTSIVALGQDRAAFLYTSQSIPMTVTLGGEIRKSKRRDEPTFTSQQFSRSYRLALWGAFMLQTEVAIAWSRPLELMDPRKLPDFPEDDLRQKKTWQPYPKMSPQASYHPHVIIQETCRLYQIAAAIREVVLSGSPEDSPLPGYNILDQDVKLDRLHRVQKDLSSWKQNLPADARITNTATAIPFDPLTNLHLACNSFQITATNLILRMDGIDEAEKDKAKEHLFERCRDITDIFEWRRRTVGLFYFGMYHGHAASLTCYALLDHLEEPLVPDQFHIAVVALTTTSHRWFISRGIVKMIWMEIQRRKLDHLLREPTLKLLQLSAVETWNAEDHDLVLKCAYPNYAVIKERGSALSEMGELIHEYSRMDVKEAGD